MEVIDVNDNPSEVTITSVTSPVSEDSSKETVVALFSVRDRDSKDKGKTIYSIQENLLFTLKPAFQNYYELVTQSPLDREEVPEYNLTITAIDLRYPQLTAERVISVQILVVNDNPPGV